MVASPRRMTILPGLDDHKGPVAPEMRYYMQIIIPCNTLDASQIAWHKHEVREVEKVNGQREWCHKNAISQASTFNGTLSLELYIHLKMVTKL